MSENMVYIEPKAFKWKPSTTNTGQSKLFTELVTN